MTVVCCGIGADTTNVSLRDARVPRIDEDGRFEYVPIPEKTRETDEPLTYGTIPRRTGDGTMADLLASLTPDPDGAGESITDPDAIAAYPPHHDPNFDALTYGEHRPGYVNRLAALDADGTDAVAFYAGLEGADGRLHRYLVGWFPVVKKTVVEADDDPETKREKLARHPANAHTRRAVDGLPYRDDRRVVLLDGESDPADGDDDEVGLLDRAGPQMSTFAAFGGERRGYFLDDEFVREFAVSKPDHDPDSTARADKAGVTRKPAIVCDLTATEFRERLFS
ncbi:hypothetical protein [Haloarchaeobius amylolyticus]|uniref:Nmad3 family putative nucleotide modification protein n=1 Tax=Haloarchaeobius amylolyticus TaxID=1198296 RepID=UPI00226E666A|nr:hypothetical protein [Haloarchaeobius amylolyticus]